ncbi:MAG: MFS transporter [Alphaproteobacteria bacterium]|nr:MFS transporter [Alphaproteobacteria bacterium]
MSILKPAVFQDYPYGAKSIFLTQACFNFGFYSLKSMIILHTIDFYSLKEHAAIEIFATLMTLSYATALLGGFLADKLIGPRNTLLIGGTLSSLGVALLIFPLNKNIFLALSFLSIGSGCFKPNLSTLLSLLFKDPKDALKDSAFTTLYVAMNLGSFIGPIFCSLASHYYGWISGFLIIVLSFVLATYLLFRATQHHNILKRATPAKKLLQAAVILVLSIVALYFLFKYRNCFNGLMGIIILISLMCFCTIFYKSTALEKIGLLKIVPYIILFAFFCALFEQAGSSIMIFFDRVVDRQILGFTIPSSSLLSLDPILVLIFGMLMPYLSKAYFKSNNKVEGLTKFGIGFFFISLSFGVLGLGSTLSSIPISIIWVFIAIFFQTVGELFIVPVGFASISKFAPSRYLSLMMSLWLMAISYGHYLAGILANFSLSAQHIRIGDNLGNYYQFFSKLSILSLSVAGILLLNALRKKSVFFK